MKIFFKNNNSLSDVIHLKADFSIENSLKMKLYLDNCMFNRPFDDQSNLKVLLESEAKLKIQENICSGIYELVWSYILDYENNKNPFRERKEQIGKCFDYRYWYH